MGILTQFIKEFEEFKDELHELRDGANEKTILVNRIRKLREYILNEDLGYVESKLNDIITYGMVCGCHERDSTYMCEKCEMEEKIREIIRIEQK